MNAESEINIAQVAIPVPIPTVFSYQIPEHFKDKIKVGIRVLVPFRNDEITGYVIAIEQKKISDIEISSKNKKAKKITLKAVSSLLDAEPAISKNMLCLTKKVSEYYGSSWGEAIENALPRWVKYGKKVEKYIEKIESDESLPVRKMSEISLTEEQSAAFKIIQTRLRESTEKKSVKPILIFGITGSGKSEIYIRAIKETLNQNKSAICLVPEIALTEQLKRFFISHFGKSLEVFHSKMTDGERFLAWKRIELGKCKVVLGPRSAVFAPFSNLGLIIMDEEHESSYKQETVPRYHSREVAAWRAEAENALFVMGTATPSMESMSRAEKKHYELITLIKRVDKKTLPGVTVIDLKRYDGDKKASYLFAPPLYYEIERNLKAREGTMLLLNRRGFSTTICCTVCKEVETCKSCQVPLTYHQDRNILVCHYCNYQKKTTDKCPKCKAPQLRFSGFGTEKVESEIARIFPTARVGRLDTDTAQKRGAHELILENFRKQKTDILIGTQMIAKGFDFPHVTLVAAILADVGVRLPDFRSGERTFQLLTQFAGRAGRGEKQGRVFIQTWMPEHPAIVFAKNHDFLGFYNQESISRKEFFYPPESSLINIIVRGRDEKKTYSFAKEMRDMLYGQITPSSVGQNKIEIIGPAPLPFYKLRGHVRWHIMIKTNLLLEQKRMNFAQDISAALAKLKKPTAVAFQIDVDPLNVL